MENKILLKEVKNFVMTSLSQNGIDDISECEWLLALSLNVNRTQLKLMQFITKKEYEKIKRVLKKRITGMPLSKIFKSASFCGYDFFVNNNVLSPRFETEILTENAISLIKNIKGNPKILDLCSGSGCIGITIKKKCENAIVSCLDISTKAIYVARKNAKKNNVNIKFINSDMFGHLRKNQLYDMIISNPPYIKSGEISKLDKEVKNFDPQISLDGGNNGLDFYKIIALESPNYLKNGGSLLLEVGFGQTREVAKLLQDGFENISIVKDLNGIERIIIANKKDSK